MKCIIRAPISNSSTLARWIWRTGRPFFDSGKIPILQPDPMRGGYRIVEHNCAIFRVAMGHPSACAAELEMFADVLGADVVRESHIVAGDRCCSYRISDPAAD